jgi:hypothetical protein
MAKRDNMTLILGGRSGGKAIAQPAHVGRTSHLYILDNRIPVPVADLIHWSTWCQHNQDKLTVAKTVVSNDPRLRIGVSTVFLTIDHQLGDGVPLVFETMVFGGPHDGAMQRCSTWEQAEAQHSAMVAMVAPVPATLVQLNE